MSAYTNSIGLGIERGWIEFKQSMTNKQDLIWTISISLIFVAVLWFQRDAKIEGFSLALLVLPGLLGMQVAQGGFGGTAGQLSYDREDGTLLRAKAIPQGMVAYLVSRMLLIILTTLVSLVFIAVPALFIVPGLTGIGIGDFLIFAWVFLLGMLATVPLGAIVGSLVKNSSSGFGLTFLPMIGIVAVSGIFYPITGLAGWLQVIGQIFPVYWLGLGMRAAFLPDAAVAAELYSSWRLGEAAIVLSIWAIIGLIIAPRILRRMARKATGSDMQARKDEMLAKGY